MKSRVNRLEKKMAGMNSDNVIMATLGNQGEVVEVVATKGRENLEGKSLEDIQHTAKKSGAVLIVDDIKAVSSDAE